MPIMYDTPELQTNESLKTFDNPDALAKSYLELQGKVSSGDISILPEDLRKDPSIAKFKNVTDVAKSYTEAQKLLGTIKHAPSKVEEYKFTALKDLHPGVGKGAESTQKFLANLFLANDIDNDRADKLQQSVLMGLHSAMVKQDEERAVKSKEVETELRNSWAGDYDKNKANVENIFKRLGLEEYGKEISMDPIKLKGIHKLTSMLSEDSIGKLGDNGSSSIDTKTKEGAAQALKDFNTACSKEGIKHPFFDDKNPKHKETVDNYNKLMEVAFG